MATIYHDSDADLSALSGQTVAVVGYGNQGRSQALNLRDSGVAVVIGQRPGGAGAANATADGFEALPIADAARRADVVDAEAVDADVGFVLDRQHGGVGGDLELDRFDPVGLAGGELGR